ncbi:MAG TPA: L-lactate permease [Steroidobacteraceae bacterium]|jgi:lactate permease|nr:L-lactate permease [Steroidobacteraceae bacterium]
MIWSQNYDPLGHPWLSTLLATLPLAVLLGGLAIMRWRAPVAALAGLATALLVAIAVFGMPVGLATRAAAYGAAYGLMPIGWIVLNIIFLYQLTQERGHFAVLRDSIAGVTDDSRLQLLLIAFCFGAFFEGAAGFGTPVAVTGAMLVGLGFSQLQAAGLSLIANTAPVAFGALGTPLITLAGVTDLPLLDLSAMVGRQMTLFALIVPFWLLVAYCGWRRTLEVWPAVLVAGVSFSATQLAISNLHGPWLTAIGAALVSIASLVIFLRFWKPARPMRVNDAANAAPVAARPVAGALWRAWLPWVVLMVLVFLWGLPDVKAWLDGIFRLALPFPGLDQQVQRLPPVVAAPTIEAAVFNFNLLSATGSAILLSGVIAGFALGAGPLAIARTYGRTLKLVAPSLLTIAAMLGLGYLTRYSGVDATLGLAFAATGVLYPFFGTLLGWLGVAVTGSDTASNVLFGGLQKVTAQQLHLSPVLMAAANSSGGVMGKMIDAQSIVVASTATRWFGQEGRILRYVFVHSLILAALVGVVVMLMAYVPPFTLLVPH